MESIRDLLTEELKDLYDAEKQLVKALPKMAKAASNQDLSQAFENHLEETRGHVLRLEKVFETLGEPAKSKSCQAMKGLIEEGKEKCRRTRTSLSGIQASFVRPRRSNITKSPVMAPSPPGRNP